jgi:hypothetical protein
MSPTKRMTRGVVVAIAAGAVAGVLAVAVAGESFEPPSPTQADAPTTYTRTAGETGLGLGPEDALKRVLVNLGSSSIEDVSFEQSPSAALNDDKPWMTFVVNGPSSDVDGGDIPPAWQADIVQGAVTELMRTDEKSANEVVAGSDIQVLLPSGERIDSGGGAGFVGLGQVFVSQTSTETDGSIKQRVAEVLAKFGLEPLAIDVYRPLGAAVSIRARVATDGPVDWTLDQVRDAVSSDPKEFEGIYLELVGAEDEPLLRASVAYRTGAGRLWFAEGEDRRFGALHG